MEFRNGGEKGVAAIAGHQLPYLNMQFQFPKNTKPASNTQLTQPSDLARVGQQEQE